MQNLISGSVHNIIENGAITTILIKTEFGKFGRTFTGSKYRNFTQWSEVRIGDHLEGLLWFDEKRGLINADSPIRILHPVYLSEVTKVEA